MDISYNRLWKLLIDRGMSRTDLRLQSGISTRALANLGKSGRVTTDVLTKICTALNCRIEDIMEMIPTCKDE